MLEFKRLLVRAVAIALCSGMLVACSDGEDTSTGDVVPDTGPDVILPDTNEGDTTDEDVGATCAVGELTAEIVASQTEGNAALTVGLECVVSGNDAGCDLLYLVEFGTGATSSQPKHEGFTYHTSGDFKVTCKAWREDGLGNVAQAEQLIRVKDSAELSLTPPKVNGASELAPGESADVTFNLKNEGGRVTEPFDVTCVLSPIPHQNWDDAADEHIELWTTTIPELDDGQFVTVQLAFANEEMTIPLETPDGDYFLICKADAADAIGETNKGDNSVFATTFIKVDSTLGLRPDLVIENLDIPENQIFPKNWLENLTYQFTLSNLGDNDAEGFKYIVNLCDAQHENCSQLFEGTIFSLDAGVQQPIILSYTVPEGTADGIYCLSAQTDTQDQVEEADEDNNSILSSSCFEVKQVTLLGTDLGIVSMACKPSQAAWNGTLSVELVVENMGNEPTGEWDMQIYLSDQPAPTQNSWLMCNNGCNNQPSIPAFVEGSDAHKFTTTIGVSIPNTIPLQDFHCLVKIDPDNEIVELDEGNNFAKNENLITISSKAYTDIYVSTVSFGPQQQQDAGDELKVTYTLGNANDFPAAGAKVCVVLSLDAKTSSSEAKSSDIILGSKVVAEVEGNAQVVMTDKYDLPLALDHTIGQYFVGVVADCDNIMGDDTNKGNNWAMADGDLVVISPQGGCFEDDLEPNGSLALAKPLNSGVTGDLGGCDDDYYSVNVPVGNSLIVNLTTTPTLSLDTVNSDLDLELYGPDGTLIDTSTASGANDQVLTFVVPAEAAYTIRVYPKNGQSEAHYSLDVTFQPPLPGTDLFPAKFAAGPSEAFSGSGMFMNWKLINLGLTPAAAFDVTIWLSPDETLDETDIEVGVLNLEGAASTLVEDRLDTIILPPEIDGGTWFAILKVDSGEVVVEENEDNNIVVSSPITIDGDNPCVDDLLVFEPNNFIEEASPLLPESQVHAGLGVCPDLDDWYAIDLEVGDRIEVHANYTYKSVNGFIYMDLIDPGGNAIIDSGTASSDANVDLPWVSVAGTYYVRVYNPKKNNWKPYLYDLEVTVEPGDAAEHECIADQFELNNSSVDAPATGCGLKTMSLCEKDRDWLTFVLPPTGSLDIELTNEGNKMRVRFYKDPTGSPFKTLSGNGSTTITNTEAAELKYWLKVEPKSTSNNYITNFPYTLFFDGIAGVDLQIDNVVPVTGATYQGEDDLVGFDISNQCLDEVSGVNFGVYLSQGETLDESATLIHEAPVGAVLPGKELVSITEKFTVPFGTASGIYNLYVMADHDQVVDESNEGNNFSSAIYEVLEICVDNGMDEPFNNIAQLAPVITAGAYIGQQICEQDLDWFALELVAGEAVEVQALFTNADGDLDLRLYADGEFNIPVVKAFATNDGETLQWTVESTGTWYLRVNGLSGAVNSYDLIVTIASGPQCAVDGECGANEICDVGFCTPNDGAGCADNSECANVCIDSVCAASAGLNGVCDETADCVADHSCVAAVCLADDAQACTDNADCANTCIGGFCAAAGLAGGTCDVADDGDCGVGSCITELCLLVDAEVCTANGECQNVCISGACAASADAGGTCDETADCVSGTECAVDTCLLSDGEICAANDDCSGACIATVCAPAAMANGACDAADDDDCSAGYSCMSEVCLGDNGTDCADNAECGGVCVGGFCAAMAATGGACDETADCMANNDCSAGTCMLVDGQACADNTDCVNTCIAALCAGTAMNGAACDAADNDDCTAGWSCSNETCLGDNGTACTDNTECTGTCLAEACADQSASMGTCDADDDDDCSAGLACGSGVCLLAAGETCAINTDCAGTCLALVCAAVSDTAGACDTDDSGDCATGNECTANVCLLINGAACVDNADCTNTCLADTCNDQSANASACDTDDDDDCIGASICVANVCDDNT